VIIHRRRRLHPVALVVYAVIFGVIGIVFAFGGTGERRFLGVVCLATAAMFVRRFRRRRRQDTMPPWAI
jgi:hypothetical protein